MKYLADMDKLSFYEDALNEAFSSLQVYFRAVDLSAPILIIEMLRNSADKKIENLERIRLRLKISSWPKVPDLHSD